MNDDLDAVGTDAPNSIAPSQNAEDEAKQFELAKFKEQNDHSRRLVAADLGIIGKIFGSKKNAASYMLLLVLIIAIIGVIVLALIDQDLHSAVVELLKVVIYGALGFFTGKSVKESEDE